MVLQRYLTELILAYARRYIRNIEAQLSLSLWGGDVLLQNLDLRLDVLQRELGVPSEFAFSRGFIRELRIHIPWTALTYKPVEVTLTDVQCVLRFNAGATQAAAAAAAAAAAGSAAPAASPTSSASGGAPPQLAAEEAAEVGGSGWAADLVTKILANLTVRINGLSFSFVEELEADTRHSAQPQQLHRSGPTLSIPLPVSSPPAAPRRRQVLLSLRVSSVVLQSTNGGFEVEFMDLEGPWKLMHKTCDITRVCVYLGEIPPEQQMAAASAANADGSSSADAVTAKLSLPDDAVILRDMSFTVRIRAYLAALGGSSLLRLPYAESEPPAACGAAVTLDVHLHQAVDLHLSDQQLLFLMHIIETKADLMTSTAASASQQPFTPAAAAATADPLSIAHLQQHIRSSAPAIITANSLQHISFAEEMQPAATKHSPAALHASPLSDATAAPALDPGGTASSSSKGWTSWLWGIVGEDDESASDRGGLRALNPAAEFHALFGHLAPKDEMIVCFQVPAVSMHLANMKQPSASSFSFNAAHAGATSEPRRKTSGATALPSSRRSATSLLAPFASVHVHEFGLQLSRQLLLPSPLGPPSRFAPLPPPPSLRPPLFSIDLVSIALVDETELHAGRPVLMCGHEQWVRSTFRFMTRGWHDAETAAMITHRRAPFEATPCLQQRQQHRDTGSKQSSSTHSPHMDPLSSSHRTLPSFASLASSTASPLSRPPTSASSGNASTGNSDDERPTHHMTAEEESMTVHGLSVMRAVIPVRENPQDASAPVTHYRCTTDVLIGPVACVLDLSCSGQSAMVEQLFTFLDLDVTTGQIGKSRRAKFNSQPSAASHAPKAEPATASTSRQPPPLIIPAHASSIAKSRQPRLLFEHRIILLHAVAAVRVHDAAEWKSDQLYLPHVDTLMLELAGARLCNAWHTQHTGSITQRLDGVHLHKLCLGYRQLQFHDDVWSERKPKLKDSMLPMSMGRPGAFSVSSSGEESWSDIGASSPHHSMDDELDEDDGLRLLDLSALRIDLSVPALRLQSSSDSFNNSAIAYFQDAILHHSSLGASNTSNPASTSTSPQPSRSASPKLRPRNAAPAPSAAAAVSAAALIPATAEVSLAALRSSFSLRQLHFLFLVTGAVCGLYAPSLQALLVRLRPRASHIQMDERLTDSLLRLEIKSISTKLEVPFQSRLNLADAGATAQQLYWNFSVGSVVTSIERGGKRRNLVVAPFDRYDAPNAADSTGAKKDPSAADPPLLTLSFSATQDVLNWFMAIIGVSTLSARSPTMFSSLPLSSSASASPSLNSAVLHLHAIALVMDSIWLDMAVFFAALTTHIRAGLANYLRAAPQRSQAAGMNKQHSYTDLQAMASHSPADFMAHQSYPPSPLVNEDLLAPSSSTIGQFVHLVLTTFLNLFRVRLTIDPLLVCFPLNDRFHLRKHPFAFRYEDVTPLVIRLPQLHILSTPLNARTNSIEINLYLRHAHIYAHRQQLRSQTGSGSLMNHPVSMSRQRKSRSLRLDNYFLATAASSGMISDVLSPWSLELSARCTQAPTSAHMLPSHSSSWRLSHVEITVVTKPLSISFTMQHALAVSMVVDSLRAMNVEAPTASHAVLHAPRASPSSQRATAAWAEVHNRERIGQTVPAGVAFSATAIASDQFPYHPSSSLVLAYPLPPSVHTALLPISYHLTLSTGKLTARFYPKCETADQLLASDMVKFDLSGIAGELACDHTFRWKQAQVAVSLSRLVYLPWQTRMAQHPVHHLFVSNGILASLERVDIPMRDADAQAHVGGFALSQRTEVVQAHAFIQPIEVMINIPALTQLGKLFASAAPTAHKFVNAAQPASQMSTDSPAVSSPPRVSDCKSTLERNTVSGGASGTLQPVQLWVCIQVERIKLAFPAPVVASTDALTAASSTVAPSLHAVACVSFELQRFWLHSNPQSVHASVLPVVQSMVAATSAFHRPQQSHKLPYAYQCASCDLVRLRKGADSQNGLAAPPPPTDLFSVDGGWQHLTVSTGEYLKSAVGDPSKPRAEDYVFQKVMLSNSIDVAVQAHFRVPTLIGVSASTPDPMRSGSYVLFTRSLLPHEWKLQFGVQFNPIILKLERRSLDLINSSLGGFSMSAELDAQEERMQALLGAGSRGRETVEDEEERAVHQQMLAASAHPQRALDLTVQVQFPQVLCELREAKSGSVLRLELEHIALAHQQSATSVDSDWRQASKRTNSVASAIIDGSLQIGRLHLIHVRSELDHHRMLTWRHSAQSSSSSSVPFVPVVVCKWTSHVMDVEVFSLDLFVPIDVLQLVVQVCQPIIHPSQVGLINSAPQAAASVDHPAPQRMRKYRVNAQTLKLLVHSGRVGIGSSAAHRSQCASLQWQTVFLLQSASQCDALWQHAVMSDPLEVRVVDLECSVGTASSSEDPFPSTTCIAPFTCVLQLNHRTKIATVDAITVAQFASLQSLISVTPRPSFVPFYRDLMLAIRVQELRLSVGFDQIAVMHSLVQQLVGLFGSQGSSAVPLVLPSAPRLPIASSGVARVMFDDDFRSMKADGVGSESVHASQSSASIRLRAGHVAFVDEPQQRVMIWKYSSPRSISSVAVRAIVGMRGGEAGASSLLLGVLSAFDPLLSVYTPVFDLLVDLQRDQYTPLPSTAIVAEEWKLTWSAPTIEHARSWAKQQGKYQRWSELMTDASPRTTLLPSSLELGQIVRVDSQLQFQYGLNVHLKLSIDHVRLALADRGAGNASADELAIVHVQGARAGGQFWMRQPIPESESLKGSALALSVVADALWLDLLQSKDLTRYPVLLPLSLSTLIRSNELAVLAPSDSGGFQFNHFLPVSLIDRRERGWCVALKADEARFKVGLKVLLTAKLIAQRMLECLAPPAAVQQPAASSVSAPVSAVPASSHYVLSNRSGLPLRYGQVGTREDVALPAGADHSYSWSSLASTLAHPAHSPPEVLNAFQPHTEPRQVRAHSDDRLRYHWMRLSSADVPAWSQAFTIDAAPAASQAQMDFSSLQKSAKARAKNDSADSSVSLRHVFVYRMFEEVQPSTRSASSASSALTPATPATPSSYAPRVMSSVHVSIVFVSVERRGLHTMVTFLPSHSLINRLPFSLSARCFTDTHASVAAPPTVPPATTTSSPDFGFGLESRRIELQSDSTTPLPLWYPCPPPQHALLYQGATSAKQAIKQTVAEPIVSPPQRTLKLLLRVHADSAPYLGRPLPQASSPTSDSSRTIRFPHTALPEYSELWEWSDAAAVPLDSLSSYLTRAEISPAPSLGGRRSDCRLCVVKHKLDLSQRLYFWAQLTTHDMPFRSAASAAPAVQPFVLPSVLSPWQLTLSPAFVFHNPLSRPITLHVSSAAYTQWNAAQSSSHSATDRWGMWLHTASKLDATAAALRERHSEDLNSASTPLLQSPARALSPPPVYASLQEVLEQGMQLEPNHTRPIMHVDPSMQVSLSFALSEQQQDASPCTFSATTHIPSSCSALPEASAVFHRSVALQRAAYASSASEPRAHLHLLLSADSSASNPAPTLRVSFAAPFKLHNLCATPMMIRSHDSSSPLSVPALTPPAGVECLQCNTDNTSRLCIGVQSDLDTFWSQPFSTRINLPTKSSPSSVLQADYELDVLAVRSDHASSRPTVLLHQFVVTVVKEVLQAMDPTAAPIACPAATAAGPCRLLTCAACEPSLHVITHVWIKPRFVVHNRTGSALRMQQTGTLASSSAAVSLSPGEIRSLEAWHPSAHDRHYDAKTPDEFGPSISLSFASADPSSSAASASPSEWSWSRSLTVLDECPRSSISVYNARCGYQRLITFVVLKHRRVRHVLLFHDAQPPFIMLNRTPLPIEFKEQTTARQKRQMLESEVPSSVLAPAQCSEFSLSHSHAHSRSSSAAPVGAAASPAPDSDDEDLSDLVSALTTPSESGWEGEERVFDHKQTLNRLVMRIAGVADAGAGLDPSFGFSWSTPVLLKPGEYSLTLPAPSPALPPVQARLAVAVRNGSILLILDALDDAGVLISPHIGREAAPITFDAAVEIASVVVSVYDEEHASITCNLGGSQPPSASHSNRTGTPKKTVPEKGSAVSSPLDSMGELLLTLSLDHVQLRSQLTGEQPLHHYLPIITASAAASNAPPRRLTPLPSSILAQLYTVLELQIGGVQLDNQLEAEFPVVLFSFNSTPAYSSAAPLPAIKLIFVSAVPLSSTPLLRQADMHLMFLQLASFGVNVEDRLGFRLASLGLSMARHLQYDFSRQPASSTRSLSAASGRDVLHASTSVSAEFEELMDKMSGARLFVHYVHIGELDFRVTVKAGAGAPVFLGAEQMPVRLDAVSLRCVLCSPDRLVQELAANYLASAIVRSPMLLGSLDLLGNPTFLLQSLSAGVRDLLFLPRNALSQGPRAFVRAVGGGLLSLLRHTTEGTLTSVSGFSSSLARNMERLSGSDLFTLQRQVLRLKRPAGLGVGLVSGVKSLSQGVIGGLVGVLSQPIAGAASGGVSGFLYGVGSGLVGVVSKPLSGMFDLVSATSQGLAHTSGVDSVAYTQRFVRRSHGGSSIESEPHCYHRFSSLKLRQMAAQMGESYLAHAVVMFAPVLALATPAAVAASVSSSAPTSPPTPQSSSHAASLSSAAREGQFALMQLTNVGIRLCHDDRVTHSFQWSDVELTHSRGKQAAGPAVTTLQAWLDQRARTEWSKYGANGPSTDEEDEADFRGSLQASIDPLSFDLLSLHSSRADSIVALWVPRSIRPALLLTAHRAQAKYSR